MYVCMYVGVYVHMYSIFQWHNSDWLHIFSCARIFNNTLCSGNTTTLPFRNTYVRTPSQGYKIITHKWQDTPM